MDLRYARILSLSEPSGRRVRHSGLSCPTVATYETVLQIPRSVDEVFAFVSDYRNAAAWDPRTYAVEKTTEGPIGIGTRFVLTGGLLREDLVKRIHLPRRLAGMALPYDMTTFDPPNEFTLEGESWAVRYRDHLEFSAQGAGTRLRYAAELELKGPMALGEPLMRRTFQRIGDDATRDLPAVVERGA